MKSFLSSRSHTVAVQNHLSLSFSPSSGVAQGSVLSPLLYTLFTAEIPTSVSSIIQTYADDTALWAATISPMKACSLIQADINSFLIWANTWHLKINWHKTQFIIFHSQYCFHALKLVNPIIRIGGAIVKPQGFITYLGVIFTESLSPCRAINSAINRGRSRFRLISVLYALAYIQILNPPGPSVPFYPLPLRLRKSNSPPSTLEKSMSAELVLWTAVSPTPSYLIPAALYPFLIASLNPRQILSPAR